MGETKVSVTGAECLLEALGETVPCLFQPLLSSWQGAPSSLLQGLTLLPPTTYKDPCD